MKKKEFKYTLSLNQLRKRYFQLARKTKMSEVVRDEILKKYGVSYAMDLSESDLAEVCEILERIISPKMPETKVMQAKVVDTIVDYLKLGDFMKNDPNRNDVAYCQSLAKTIAEGASGYVFSQIPTYILRLIYRDYRKRRHEYLEVERLIR
ncbi:MAG TPA: hypothetical protein DHV48_05700 [Prolixibacteraceae bacterium]|nr:hypothetical protein [Prolixibacteraceae bacterium]